METLLWIEHAFCLCSIIILFSFFRRKSINHSKFTHPFSERVQRIHPQLNKRDIELIESIKCGETNYVIQQRWSVSPSAVHKAKYRLKLKLGLPKEQRLDDYVRELNG